MRLKFLNLYVFLGFALFLFSVTTLALAGNQDQIDKLLKSESPPFGVVFEVIESSTDELDWVFPRIKNFADALRNRFPEIGIAVVSHGKEEFGLLKSAQKKKTNVHKLVKSLVADNIPVHVCGTHASWYDKKPEDFPEYINVSPAGPTEIDNYQDMGYILITIRK